MPRIKQCDTPRSFQDGKSQKGDFVKDPNILPESALEVQQWGFSVFFVAVDFEWITSQSLSVTIRGF